MQNQVNNLQNSTIAGDAVNNTGAQIRNQTNYFQLQLFDEIQNIDLKNYKNKKINVFDHIAFYKKYKNNFLIQYLLYIVLVFSIIFFGFSSTLSGLIFIVFLFNYMYLDSKSDKYIYEKEINIKDNHKIKFINPKFNLDFIFDFRPKYRVKLYNSDNKYKTIYFGFKYDYDLFKAEMQKYIKLTA